MEFCIFWFRRDLRIDDNCGLYHALISGYKVMPIFIWDKLLIEPFTSNQRFLNLIYDELNKLNLKLDNSLQIFKGNTIEVLKFLTNKYSIKAVYANEEYEPTAIKRDNEVQLFLKTKNIQLFLFKDIVIFHKNEILKNNKEPYTIYTPYKKTWLANLKKEMLSSFPSENLLNNIYKVQSNFLSKEELNIVNKTYILKPLNIKNISEYEKYRDIPYLDRTSNASVYLRLGTLSIRKLVKIAIETNQNYLNELIWREFFIQILYHFPKVEKENFRSRYNRIEWPNNEIYWKRWCKGETGYPIVDAGIKQLLQTGYIHNRVRMIVASFLTKNLLIDWRWGEAFFAKHLLDYDISANNGNWQWAASTGCDAVPYFRIFNPILQQQKYDANFNYIKTWIPNFKPNSYIKPIVNFNESKENAIKFYKKALLNT